MAFPSSIAIVFIGVAAYAVTAGPVQGISNTVQRDEYESPVVSDFLARYLEDRRTNERTKRNDDPYAYGQNNNQHTRLLDLENHLSQHSDSDEILEGRKKISVNGLRGEIHNSPLNSEIFIDSSNHHPYENAGQLYTHQLVNHDVLDNSREHDGRLVKSHDDNLDRVDNGYLVRNLDQIGGGHLVRNLDQIGGGHLVRNPEHHDGGHRARNLDQIGGGHLVRNPDQSGGYFVSNLGHIGEVHIPGNLDHIGGEHLVRHPDQIGGEHLVGNPDQIDDENLARRRAYSNIEARRRVNQPAVASRRLDAAVASRQLDAAVASRQLDAAIASRQLDAAVASRQLQQAAVDSRRLQAAARKLSRIRTDSSLN